MKRFIRIGIPVFATLTIALHTGCGDNRRIELNTDIAGHQLAITVLRGDLKAGRVKDMTDQAVERCRARLAEFDQAAAGFKLLEESDTSVVVSEGIASLIAKSEELRTLTGGGWDPRLARAKAALLAAASDSISPVELADKARDATVNLGSDHSFSTGGAPYDLSLLAPAWALDGAAQTLIEGGVLSGFCKLDGYYRIWGTPIEEGRWQIEMPDVPEDSTDYTLKPEAGGLLIFTDKSAMNLSRLGPPNPEDESYFAEPEYDFEAMVTWAADAVTAAAFNEAFKILGRRWAMEWFAAHPEAGLVIRYSPGSLAMIETDPVAADWLEARQP